MGLCQECLGNKWGWHGTLIVSIPVQEYANIPKYIFLLFWVKTPTSRFVRIPEKQQIRNFSNKKRSLFLDLASYFYFLKKKCFYKLENMVTDILALFLPLWGQRSYIIKMVALALHTYYYYCHLYKRKDSKPAKKCCWNISWFQFLVAYSYVGWLHMAQPWPSLLLVEYD